MTNHRETRYGKGDVRRPEDHKKFSENFDAIFGKKNDQRKERKFAREVKHLEATRDRD
mgnify:CR=1 FL=1|jgi:uncharacterized protein with von Willebrand factor type A (vWA) domain